MRPSIKSKFKVVLIFTTFISYFSFGQNTTTICLGDDLTICAGDGVTIDICPPAPGSTTQDTNVVYIGNAAEQARHC